MSTNAPLIVHEKLEHVSALRPVALDSRQFTEDQLQKLLFEHPELLPASEVDASFSKLIPLAREFPTTVGPIDVLYVTNDGLLCIVETKLWRNPEAHRTVLAQILEYARHLTTLSYSEFKAKVEAAASRNGRPIDLLKVISAHSSKADFDNIAFEEGVRRSLATGSFLLLIVGDRIRPEVAMLSEILGTAPNLEFTLGLIEIAFYHLDPKDDWPIVAVPSVVGRTYEETRTIVKIRYEQKQPEVEVSAEATSPLGHTDAETFLKSLPEGFDEVFRPYLERWMSGPFMVYWGKVGFSLKAIHKNRWKTIIDAYPTELRIFLEKWLPEWDNPIQAYQSYHDQISKIPEVQRVYGQGKSYAFYNRMTQDELRVLLKETDQLAQALVTTSRPS